ncbi:MAG TPA: hypothetical protein VFP10_14850, partial [Candidatus Eisenbacteria bacterium]|nr:hypothetical protein [Candidatus Eisenbacteria bacterium]
MKHFPLPQSLRWVFPSLLLFVASRSAEAVDFGASQVLSPGGSYNSLVIDIANTKHVATYDA